MTKKDILLKEIPDIHELLLAELTLKKDWLKPEEDEVGKNL